MVSHPRTCLGGALRLQGMRCGMEDQDHAMHARTGRYGRREHARIFT